MRHLILSLFLVLIGLLSPVTAHAAEPGAFETPIESALPDSVTYTNGALPHTKIVTQDANTLRAVLDWNSFNIGRDAAVEFKQLAGSGSVTVNRVVGGGTDPSKILGKLTANGTVVILDPNGVIFGTDAVIDVGGIVASTGRLTNQTAFEAGQDMMLLADMDAVAGAAVINHSTQFTVRDRGLAAFVAPAVQNKGIITAHLGHVILASGKAATLDFYGDRMINIAVTEGLAAALPAGSAPIDNSGKIIASGGTVQMTARAASTAIDKLINSNGLVVATKAEGRNGKIILSNGAQTKTLENSIRVGQNSRIQEALDMAPDGTAIHINEGIYRESLTITKPVALQAYQTAESVTLWGKDGQATITVNAPNVEISGLAFLYGLNGILAQNADGLFVHDSVFNGAASHAIDLTNTRPFNDLNTDTSNIFISIGGKNVFFNAAAGASTPDNSRIFNTPVFGGFGSAPLVIEQVGMDVSALAALAPAAGDHHCANGSGAGCGGN
jgi:filamentous hemagglutinin family protein